MTEFAVSYPRPDDVDRYSVRMGIPRDAIVRDIVRLVSLARMAHEDELNDEWVVSGGMGLRLRGSPRFTMVDTDTSRVGRPEEIDLAEALAFEDADVVISPAHANEWRTGRRLVTAKPVDYEAFFASVGAPVADSFTFTVSWRGLFERPDRLPLRHSYPELVLPEVAVPVMDVTEQAAEKIVGWCAHGLMKHYVDVAWIFHHLGHQVAADKLGPLTERKLAVGRELFPGRYAVYSELHTLFKPLYDPDRLVPPLGELAGADTASMRFSEGGLNKVEAIAIMRSRVLPALFGGSKLPPTPARAPAA